MKTLTELRQYLNTIPNINEGGCLISAYSVYLYLKQNNTLSPDFKIIEISPDTLTKYMNTMQYLSSDPESNVFSCGHAVILYNGYIYDSEIDVKMDEFVDAAVFGIWIDPKDHEQWLINQMNNASWNESFDRMQYIPEIEKELGIDLSMVKLYFTEEEQKEAEYRFKATHQRLVDAKKEYERNHPPKFDPQNAIERLFGEMV
jgi:hypothetical protein